MSKITKRPQTKLHTHTFIYIHTHQYIYKYIKTINPHLSFVELAVVGDVLDDSLGPGHVVLPQRGEDLALYLEEALSLDRVLRPGLAHLDHRVLPVVLGQRAAVDQRGDGELEEGEEAEGVVVDLEREAVRDAQAVLVVHQHREHVRVGQHRALDGREHVDDHHDHPVARLGAQVVAVEEQVVHLGHLVLVSPHPAHEGDQVLEDQREQVPVHVDAQRVLRAEAVEELAEPGAEGDCVRDLLAAAGQEAHHRGRDGLRVVPARVHLHSSLRAWTGLGLGWVECTCGVRCCGGG